jgi:sentrin-specific protease 1
METGRFSYARVKRWTNQVDVFDTDKIIIPVNLDNTHWVVSVVHNGTKRIEIFDSLGGGNMPLKNNLLQWLREEHMTRRGSTLPSEWTAWSPPADSSFPQEHNDYDCGVFTCMYVRGRP